MDDFEEERAVLRALVEAAERGDLYEDYDRGTELVGKAREAVDALDDFFR